MMLRSLSESSGRHIMSGCHHVDADGTLGALLGLRHSRRKEATPRPGSHWQTFTTNPALLPLSLLVTFPAISPADKGIDAFGKRIIHFNRKDTVLEWVSWKVMPGAVLLWT